MTLLDDGSDVQDFLSSGLGAEESERLWLMPDGLRLSRPLSASPNPRESPTLLSTSTPWVSRSSASPCGGWRFSTSWRRLCSTGRPGGPRLPGRLEGCGGVQPVRPGDHSIVRLPGSAGLRQLPCLGVWWNSKRLAMRRPDTFVLVGPVEDNESALITLIREKVRGLGYQVASGADALPGIYEPTEMDPTRRDWSPLPRSRPYPGAGFG